VELEPNSIKRTNESTLVIGNVKEQEVSDLLFFDVGTDNAQRVIVAGKSAVRQARDRSVLMQLQMEDAVIIMFKPKDRTTFDTISSKAVRMNIFNSTIFPSASMSNPREYTSVDLYKRIGEMRQNESTSPLELNIYQMEFHKKFSLPFASFFFALLALPLAIIFGTRNGQTIGFVLGIVICVMYWAMIILGQGFASRNGFNGMVSMWLPNAIIGVMCVFCYIALKRK
jgi:lipopolysaccharide export system permease protein